MRLISVGRQRRVDLSLQPEALSVAALQQQLLQDRPLLPVYQEHMAAVAAAGQVQGLPLQELADALLELDRQAAMQVQQANLQRHQQGGSSMPSHWQHDSGPQHGQWQQWQQQQQAGQQPAPSNAQPQGQGQPSTNKSAAQRLKGAMLRSRQAAATAHPSTSGNAPAPAEPVASQVAPAAPAPAADTPQPQPSTEHVSAGDTTAAAELRAALAQDLASGLQEAVPPCLLQAAQRGSAVLFLGTGSAEPSKYRGPSGILLLVSTAVPAAAADDSGGLFAGFNGVPAPDQHVHRASQGPVMPGSEGGADVEGGAEGGPSNAVLEAAAQVQAVLLDCGEGVAGQLLRMLGPAGAPAMGCRGVLHAALSFDFMCHSSGQGTALITLCNDS